MQQSLPLQDGQTPKKKRRGASKGGRPAQGSRSSERHEVRDELKRHEPVHVVVRAVSAVRTLRRRDVYKAMRAALAFIARRLDFRVVHLSIQGTHVHLLAEADDKEALARGMQALQISAAKRINRQLTSERGKPRKGAVFADRYHARIIRSPREARNALSYVLNNWRKHREDQHGALGRYPVDVFSSAPVFRGWRDLDHASLVLPDTYQPLPVSAARTWLLTCGWQRHGLISCYETPASSGASVRRVVADA